MNKIINKSLFLVISFLLYYVATCRAVAYEQIDHILGYKGIIENDRYTIKIPYHNINVFVDGFKLTPAMELEFEIQFFPLGNESMVMGEICLLETEVPMIQQLLLSQGFKITAIHNHFIRESKPISFLHFQGMGQAEEIALSLKAIQGKVNALRRGLYNQEARVNNTLNIAALDKSLNMKGTMFNGVYKINIDRPDLTITDHGVDLDTDSWITFQGSPKHAALAGEFALKESQVQPFIQALSKNKIEFAALHNHMTTEKPRIFFVHPWGVGKVEQLTQGIKEALATLN